MSDSLPTIKLGGVEYPVKELVIAQLEVVWPALLRLSNIQLKDYTSDNMRDLSEVIYQAIAPAQNPPMKRDDFRSLPGVNPYQMYAAIGVIMKQGNLIAKDAAPGEDQAGAAPPQTLAS